ncbi:MAG: ATP-binding protein, partial [Halomonas sp.]|nr:ATP-binding protein [Halomonas sp.]
HSLHREIAWRDDQMLRGRLERMEALLDDGESVTALRERPQLYANMLGNRDSLLWILDPRGEVLIEVNPGNLAVPTLPASREVRLDDVAGAVPARLAWQTLEQDGRPLTLVAGKLLDERRQMLSAYRLRLWLALATGALLAFLLGWGVSRRGLGPLRRLAEQANRIDVRHLDRRLNDAGETEEIGALSLGLNRMLERLEEGFFQLSRYSADMAHELRTPLANARRHGRRGTPIRFDTLTTPERVALRVQNQGEPIAPEELALVFERFYRCDPARTGAVGSGGLGLAIVRSIAQWHGGEVGVEISAEGQSRRGGTTTTGTWERLITPLVILPA